MKNKILRVLAASLCMVWALGLADSAYAQETKKKESADSTDAEAVSASDPEEGDEDAELAAARRRYGPNKAGAKIGDDEIFLIAGRPDIEKDPAYPKVDSLKAGEIVEMTLGQAVKFSTPFDVKFGNLLIKKENVAPNYPGVYSIWMKRTSGGWSFVFNEKPDIWGTMHKSASDVGETAATYVALDEPVKGIKLKMSAEDGAGELSIAWGKHEWSAPFTIEQ